MGQPWSLSGDGQVLPWKEYGDYPGTDRGSHGNRGCLFCLLKFFLLVDNRTNRMVPPVFC